MQIVINIPKEDYEKLIKYGEPLPRGNKFDDAIMKAVSNGIPIPKGHGKLIDARELKTSMTCYMMDKNKTHEAKYVMSVAKGIVDLQKTIIEADKESEK